MTTLPNALVSTINHERMPVILTEDKQFDTWLHGSTQDAMSLVHSHDPERMRMVQSGFKKEDLLA